MIVELGHYLILASMLFTIGVIGVFLNRKNVIIILMSLELILLSISINLVAFSSFLNDPAGQIFSLFILTVAAGEAALAFALVFAMYRATESVEITDAAEMKN